MPKSDKSLNEQDELRRLREENARLKELLTRHGIAWEEPAIPEPVPAPTESAPTPTHFTTNNKIALVHRTELLRQWQGRMTGFLEFPKECLGAIGGGKKKPSGKIDIAVMQSLSRREDLGELLYQCGPIRHSAARPETAPAHLEVWPKVLPVAEIPPDSPIQEVFRILANDSTRNRRIAENVLTAYRK